MNNEIIKQNDVSNRLKQFFAASLLVVGVSVLETKKAHSSIISPKKTTRRKKKVNFQQLAVPIKQGFIANLKRFVDKRS